MHTDWYTCSPVFLPSNKGDCAKAAWENTSAKAPKDKRLRNDIGHITTKQNKKEQEPNAHHRRHAAKPHALVRHQVVILLFQGMAQRNEVTVSKAYLFAPTPTTSAANTQ